MIVVCCYAVLFRSTASPPIEPPPSPVELSVSTSKDQYTVQLPQDSVKIFGSVYPPSPEGTYVFVPKGWDSRQHFACCTAH